MWLPGVGQTNAPDGSISKRRISAVKSRVARKVAPRHSISSGMLLGGFPGRGQRLLIGHHAIDQSARPKRTSVNIEIVERHARMSIDRTLLCLEHDVVLIVN